MNLASYSQCRSSTSTCHPPSLTHLEKQTGNYLALLPLISTSQIQVSQSHSYDQINFFMNQLRMIETPLFALFHTPCLYWEAVQEELKIYRHILRAVAVFLVILCHLRNLPQLDSNSSVLVAYSACRNPCSSLWQHLKKAYALVCLEEGSTP